MAKKKAAFSDNINRLENIINIIENSDTSIEDSIKLYKEAIDISLICAESLNSIEKEVVVLQKTASGIFEKKEFTQTLQEAP